jgi:outer membrane protein assembly factor BamE (lipoprotein component of BamABCDE complex)
MAAVAPRIFARPRMGKGGLLGEDPWVPLMRTSLLLGVLLVSACVAMPGDADASSDEELTVGLVQREIRLGMSGADVVEVLGSPNIVSTDENRNEVWVWDRISTQVIKNDRAGGVLLLGFGAHGGGLLGGQGSKRTETRTQRTLTIIVKFDEESRVRDFAYHTSRF